jgi:hypothetical protein
VFLAYLETLNFKKEIEKKIECRVFIIRECFPFLKKTKNSYVFSLFFKNSVVVSNFFHLFHKNYV